MANPAFIKIQGTNQGLITAGACSVESVGNMAVEDHIDESRILEVLHKVYIPKDPHSGMATGQRIHEAIELTKMTDKASPLLYNALSSNEVLDTVEIKYYRPSATGALEHYLLTTLSQAQIAGISHYLPNVLDVSKAHINQYEIVSISYSKIVIEHVVAGTTFEDSFREVGV